MTIDNRLTADIERYIEDNFSQMLDDLASLIEIPSVMGEEEPGAPYGREVRRALDRTLDIAKRLGFDTDDGDGYVGYASLPGTEGLPGYLATIAHVDVVPAGDGWHFDPFRMTEKDGWLIGRGTDDDKNAVIITLYAAKYIRDNFRLRHDFRFLFGCNEENAMKDIPVYLSRNEEPLFCLVPDVFFPATNGEKGCYVVRVISGESEESRIIDISGGTVSNAVPASAAALIRTDRELTPCNLLDPDENDPEAPGSITIEDRPEGKLITAAGKGGHCSNPKGTVNAIGLLARYLTENNLVGEDDKPYMDFLNLINSDYNGKAVGINCSDEIFKELTAVGSIIEKKDGKISLTIDCRFPGSATWKEIHRRFEEIASQSGADIDIIKASDSFYIEPDYLPVATCVDVSNSVLGRSEAPEAIGGTTFARMFRNAIGFGLDDMTEDMPEFVGMLHGPDEGFSIRQFKIALKIYILALLEIDKLDY